MFGLDPVWLVVVVAVGLLAEVALVWASSALADAPDQGLGKLLSVSAGVFLACFAAAVGIAAALNVLHDPLAEERRGAAYAAIGLAILACAVLPTLAYPSLLSVSMGKGAWMGVVQTLLRVFLYVLIIALVMVVLAVLQISRGPGEAPKAEAPAPPPALVARL
ncbi:MAG: hypothetical protein K2W96_06970 [Gemmataceae bacterium]|nr:hypothetical protein [Gemmataceae bacterium]